MTGPKAAPNPAHAKDTIPNTELDGFHAIKTPSMAMRISEILEISTDYILTGKGTTDDAQSLVQRIERLPAREREMLEMLVAFCSKDPGK